MRRLQKFLPLSWRQRKSAEWLETIRRRYDEGIQIRDATTGYNRAFMEIRLARLAEIITMAEDEFAKYGVIGNLNRERLA